MFERAEFHNVLTFLGGKFFFNIAPVAVIQYVIPSDSVIDLDVTFELVICIIIYTVAVKIYPFFFLAFSCKKTYPSVDENSRIDLEIIEEMINKNSERKNKT